jgi:hypothetical protein
MSFIGSNQVSSGPASGLRFASTRGRIQGSPVNGVNYPSEFFDIAHTYLPVTVKQLFKWCRYYFLTNPLVNATVFKLSEYPVTDVIIEHESPAIVKLWTEYFHDHLRYRSFQVECGLDYHCYGNGCVSLGYPFKKYLQCRSCEWKEQASKVRPYWVFTNYAFRLTCPRCGSVGDAIPSDVYFKNASGIKTIRWNPEDIEISYNDITGEYTHFYTIPAVVRNDIVIGRKDIVEGVPQIFIQAMREQKGVVFAKDQFFHMRRPTLATQDRGWGIPLLLPVLKDTFYLQIMKKAQEAILLEHIVPLRILFPQAGSGTSDPYTTINLVDWRDHVAAEIARWRWDKNYIPILPLPIGNQTIGGDGKALMLTGEIQQWSEQIMVGMGVPREFLLGGMSYAGTNVSMRMLENAFIGYLQRHKALAKFMMKNVASFLGWPEANIRFKPFKMADDIQRKAYLFQLNQSNKVSDRTLLADADLSQEDENATMINETDMRLEAMKKQQLALAVVQGQAQVVMMKYQAKAQMEMQTAMMAGAAPGEPGGAETGGAAAGAPGGQGGGAPGASMPVMGQQADGSGGLPGSPLNAGQKMPTQETAQGVQMGGMNVDIASLAQMQAKMIAQLPPAQQSFAINNLRMQSADLAQMVESLLSQMQSGGQGGAGGGGPQVDMRPLPEQQSPRRAMGMV